MERFLIPARGRAKAAAAGVIAEFAFGRRSGPRSLTAGSKGVRKRTASRGALARYSL